MAPANKILNRARKLIKWLSILLLVLLTIFIVAINVFAFAFEGKDSAINSYFTDLNTAHELRYTEFEDTRIRTVHTGPSNSRITLLFIHGAPGNLDNFKAYLADSDMNTSYRMISMDRLGYGGSDTGNSELDLTRQAEAAHHILSRYGSELNFIVSHSYGCPVAGKLAMDHPESVAGIVMIAPLIDPYNEPLALYSLLADSFLGRLLLPEFIDVASDEKMAHSRSLKKIESGWSRIDIPVLHIHGQKDGLAPYEPNVTFSKERINNQYLTIVSPEDMGHMLIWLNAAYVKKQIINFIEENV